MIFSESSGLFVRGDFSAKMNPRISAPSAAHFTASSFEVIPHTFISGLSFFSSRREAVFFQNEYSHSNFCDSAASENDFTSLFAFFGFLAAASPIKTA